MINKRYTWSNYLSFIMQADDYPNWTFYAGSRMIIKKKNGMYFIVDHHRDMFSWYKQSACLTSDQYNVYRQMYRDMIDKEIEQTDELINEFQAKVDS